MSRLRRATFGTGLAMVLVVVFSASPVLAIYWGGEVKLSTAQPYRPEILRTGTTSAIALWTAGFGSVVARRTADLGFNWTGATTVLTGTSYLGASAYGKSVDLAYVKRVRNSAGTLIARVFYRRSTNGGATWSAATALSGATAGVSDAVDVDVARASGGRVTVVWTQLYTGRLYIRSSLDGGVTFGGARYAGTTGLTEPGNPPIHWSDPALAIGSGVVYLAYSSNHESLAVKRTLDRGVSWSSTTTISTNASPPFKLLAVSDWAVLGYTSFASGTYRAAYRRTFNRGRTWSSARFPVYPGSGEISSDPDFTYQAGILAIIFRYGALRTAGVWHRITRDVGTTWYPMARVSSTHNVSDSNIQPGGVAILDGRHLAGYFQEDREGVPIGYFVRRGAP